MVIREEISDNENISLYEVFGKQKVKWYEIKHFIFDFGGVMINKTFVLKNLFSILEADLNIDIIKKEGDPYIKKIRRQATSGVITSREFLDKLFERYKIDSNYNNTALPQKKNQR